MAVEHFPDRCGAGCVARGSVTDTVDGREHDACQEPQHGPAAQLTPEQREALEIILDIAVDSIDHSDYGDATTEAEEREAVAIVKAMLAPETVPA